MIYIELNSQCTAIGLCLCCCGGGGWVRLIIEITHDLLWLWGHYFKTHLECQQGSSCCVFRSSIALGGSPTHLWPERPSWNMSHELQLATKATCVFSQQPKNCAKPVGILKKCVSSQKYRGVSENIDTPKSSILIGFSIINHPFWGTPIFGNTHSIIDAFRCHFQEEHYATFRAELEAIIHAQDVEDGNLTGRKHSRCCGQGYWDETNYCEDIVIKTFGLLYSMRCMHTWILIYIKRHSIQQLFQPVQLHATDYTWFMITPHINQQVFNLKKQMHPHLDAVNCFIQPSFS